MPVNDDMGTRLTLNPTPKLDMEKSFQELEKALDQDRKKLEVMGVDPGPKTIEEAVVDSKDVLGRDRVIGLRNGVSTVGVNPKDKIGAAKVDMTLLSVPAKIAWAKAAMEGAHKYGAYNWRVEPVLFRTYIGAIMRHCDEVLEGEFIDPESLIEHLGHVIASAAILIDAAHQRKLIDDRPIQCTNEDGTAVKSGAVLIREANDWIKNNKPAGWGR